MSYDIRLTDPITKEPLLEKENHQLTGGMYAIGGTKELWLNVTYNYGSIFYRVMGENGIRAIYGMSGAESIPVLKEAIAKLGNDVDPDYWKATEGNAKRSLYKLLALAQMRPDGIWEGD
jgi:hypothetical protein